MYLHNKYGLDRRIYTSKSVSAPLVVFSFLNNVHLFTTMEYGLLSCEVDIEMSIK